MSVFCNTPGSGASDQEILQWLDNVLTSLQEYLTDELKIGFDKKDHGPFQLAKIYAGLEMAKEAAKNLGHDMSDNPRNYK